MKDSFLRQAGLILRILPLIHQEQVFALKGGTAINFFVRNLPRLSVDIDLVYLIGHNRPMSELLDPRLSDMRHVFENEFLGMTRIPCEYEDLVETRARLVALIRSSLTGEEKAFIASIQEGDPRWDLLGLSDISRLPAVRWKLLNVAKMNSSKKNQEVQKLRAYLEV